jgi:MFS family permease
MIEQTLTPPTTVGGLRRFVVIWLGQLVSLTGSGLSNFALGVWVYQRTGSATQFALIALFATLPGILVSPIAGAVVDRMNRRHVMILSDIGACLSTVTVVLLLLTDYFAIWQLYVATAFSSFSSAFQWPAYMALTTQLVPKEQFGRASGMMQMSEAAAQLISPVLAGALLAFLPIQGILFIDFITFAFAITALLLIQTPRLSTPSEDSAIEASVWRDVAYGWAYVRARPGLLGLMLFFAATNFTVGMVQVLLTPLVLSFASATTLGIVLSVAGVGMLAGTLVMSAWGGPKRRINGVLGFTLPQGLLLLLGGLQPNAWLVAVAAFAFLFCLPIINGCSQAIWQSKVPPETQGRVFAIRTMVAWSSLPLAYLVAGPLAERVFEPLMAANGVLATSVGALIGVGSGRGVGLLLMALGLMTMLAPLIGYLYPRVRRIEQELPDAAPVQS